MDVLKQDAYPMAILGNGLQFPKIAMFYVLNVFLQTIVSLGVVTFLMCHSVAENFREN